MTQADADRMLEQIPAPALAGGEWLQGEPVVVGSGQPVLVEFWDYTCMNCIRTLPYLAEWHRRYEQHGLRIVGVHTPEFSFAGNADYVRRAIDEFDIPYPVLLDPRYEVWKSYDNRYWPAKYFVDGGGTIRARHFGEGGYGDAETFIQMLLREREGFAGELPPIMEPVRAEDAPGAVCYRVTPELYCGYQRGLVGNVGDLKPDSPTRYRDPGHHVQGTLYLDGAWLLAAESVARPVGGGGPSRLILDYMAADVNLIMHPPTSGETGLLRVLLDGAPVSGEAAGADVVDGVVRVERPQMYRLVSGADTAAHELVLETESDGLAAYAFTFTSCVTPPPDGV